MILATRRDGSRDGELLVVSADRKRAASARPLVSHMQAALENWQFLAPKLAELKPTFELNVSELMAPLPRTYAWMDGSSYLNHVILARKARGVEVPADLKTNPLMYRGGGDRFLGAQDPIEVPTEEWGVDFEAEVAVITDNVAMGALPEECASAIRLVMLCNDVSLRNLIPEELAKGFGFVHSKAPTAFSPFALTPDELGKHWHHSRVHLPLETKLNGEFFGNPEAGEAMHFSFADLISHAAKTRSLSAGTIIGSGTVSNDDLLRGSSCIVERRLLEQLEKGQAKTTYLRFGDRVTMDMSHNGVSLFGKIDQFMKKREKRIWN